MKLPARKPAGGQTLKKLVLGRSFAIHKVKSDKRIKNKQQKELRRSLDEL